MALPTAQPTSVQGLGLHMVFFHGNKGLLSEKIDTSFNQCQQL